MLSCIAFTISVVRNLFVLIFYSDCYELTVECLAQIGSSVGFSKTAKPQDVKRAMEMKGGGKYKLDPGQPGGVFLDLRLVI